MENTHVTYYCFNKNCSVSIYNTDTAITLLMPYDEITFAAPQRCALCSCQLISWIDLDVKSLLLGQHIPSVLYRQAS
ncbi:hypothetical protein [Mucilaginibacter dorajii]|uniref:Uncharacterized protein n=1 Tax=Mucilaginibacter dorajii TaxID=692994 RepID=A0ABP7PPR9_9SPHI|nr:hypothetical protein [Mucilaginibacter dorajii]MCS3733731.1 hypothetical protein [Mucilaginibacter dorajii]